MCMYVILKYVILECKLSSHQEIKIKKTVVSGFLCFFNQVYKELLVSIIELPLNTPITSLLFLSFKR